MIGKINRRNMMLGGLGAALPLPSIAQADYPNRPIRVVIGFPPGGGVDTIGRPTFQRLSQRIGQPIAIDNRSGNNGNIAMDHVTKSPADGYTLFFGNVGNYTTQALFPNPGFDTVRDFAYVCRVHVGPLAVAVPADFPARTLQEFMEIARRRPGELNFGSGGSGGVPHFAFEILKQQTKLDIVHVPYRGSGPALQDLLGGRVQLMVDGYGLMRGAHEAGRVRVLAITSRQRHPNLPDVPTVAEAGVPGYEFTSWSALAAPAATPPAILSRLEDAMRWTMDNTDLPQTLLGFGTFPAFAPGAEVRENVVKERDAWTRIAREVNIRAD